MSNLEPDLIAKKKVEKSITDMVLEMPFFASLVLYLRRRQNTDMPTAGVDGINYFYNPEFVKGLTDKQMLFLSMHECMHCALNHMDRLQGREPKKFNVACDYVINLVIDEYNKQEKMNSLVEYPPGVLLDAKWAGMSSEEVYAKLEDPTDEEKESGGFGGVMLAPDKDDKDLNPESLSGKEIETNWKVASKQAVQAAKMQGDMSGAFAEMLGEMLEPKVNWQDKLRRFMTSHDKSGFSWSRVNRRYRYRGLTLPSRWAEAVGTIVIAIDTSASVSTAELMQFQGEINSILSETSPKRLIVLHVDTVLQKVEEFAKEDLPLNLEVAGRGGTLFEPAFEYVKQNDVEPECLLYFTDLGASSNFDPPNYPVMWINTDKSQPHPSWGETIDLILN